MMFPAMFAPARGRASSSGPERHDWGSCVEANGGAGQGLPRILRQNAGLADGWLDSVPSGRAIPKGKLELRWQGEHPTRPLFLRRQPDARKLYSVSESSGHGERRLAEDVSRSGHV